MGSATLTPEVRSVLDEPGGGTNLGGWTRVDLTESIPAPAVTVVEIDGDDGDEGNLCFTRTATLFELMIAAEQNRVIVMRSLVPFAPPEMREQLEAKVSAVHEAAKRLSRAGDDYGDLASDRLKLALSLIQQINRLAVATWRGSIRLAQQVERSTGKAVR